MPQVMPATPQEHPAPQMEDTGFSLDRPPAPWPDWLEEHRIDDDVVDAAYEATPPRLRAAIKTGLALAFSHFGQWQEHADSVVHRPHAGFWFGTRMRPVPWCLVVLDASYAAAARLAAACVLPRLRDVPEVFAVVVGENHAQPTDNALAALTLSGIDDVFCLSAARTADLVAELASKDLGAQGRLVLLHDGGLGAIAAQARQCHVPCHEEAAPPALAVLPDAPCDGDLLAFAHGAVSPARGLTPATRALIAPALDAQGHERHPEVSEALERGLLVLTPGCEGFWLHEGLGPAFFRAQGMVAGML